MNHAPLAVTRPLLVAERTGRWALALWQTLAAETAARVAPCEARTLDEATALVARPRLAVALVELELDQPGAVCQWVASAKSRQPALRVAVVAQRGREAWLSAAWQAGADYFTTSPRRLHCVAHWLAMQPTPEPAGDLPSEIWSRLPWDRFASV